MKRALPLVIAPIAILLSACAQRPAHPQEAPMPQPEPAPQPTSLPANPLLSQSPLPYGLPPFDQIHDADFAPAFDAGMTQQRQQVDAIANNPGAPTFDNTLVALERSGDILNRTQMAFDNLVASNNDEALLKTESDYAPKLSVHRDAILLNPALFARVDALWRQRASLGLDAESLQLLDRYHTLFVHAGAQLSDADKEKLKTYNEQLSSLTTTFQQNVRKATKDGAIVVDSDKQLAGLSQEQIGTAAQAAKARGLEGKWVIPLANTTIQPPLAQLENRALRKRIFEASSRRGIGGDTDNTAIVAQIVQLRAKLALLFGDANYATYALKEETAGAPQAVNAMLAQIAPAAIANAQREAADIQHEIDRDAHHHHRAPFELEPWDWAYYAERVRRARFSFSEDQVKPYFELDRVLQDGVFYAAHELYGLTFKERKDLPVYQSDVRVFEVFDADGTPMGLFLADYFARDNKNGGAWMNNYVGQSYLLGEKPVIVNNLNIPKPAPGQPVLLTFDEVTTLFHEFGHAMHGMLSAVKYPLLSGTATPPDFVEYPSQYNEMWARDASVLAHYAKHYQTGAAMPQDLLDKVLAAQKFGQGYATTEYLEAAMLDQRWHQISAAQTPDAAGVTAFEHTALVKDQVYYPPVPPRYHSAYFSHVFSNGYAAGYYAYLWSEVLARDTEAWFRAHGGLSRENGMVLREKVLSRGHTQNLKTMFEAFYGKPADIEPLLEHRGLTLPKKKPENKKPEHKKPKTSLLDDKMPIPLDD
jgi:peptidyl-dipeptidase Dcp